MSSGRAQPELDLENGFVQHPEGLFRAHTEAPEERLHVRRPAPEDRDQLPTSYVSGGHGPILRPGEAMGEPAAPVS